MLWKLVEEKVDLAPLPAAIHERLMELVRSYIYCGGMPEVVSALAAAVPLSELRALQIEIQDNYRSDFAKHAPAGELGRILAVWQGIPGFLGKENKKFMFADLEESGRATNFAAAIQWLTTAGLVYQCHRAKEPTIPLLSNANMRSFKLYPHDVGLLGAAMHVPSSFLVERMDRLHHLFRGALVEAFIAGQLKMQLTNRTSNRALYYWRSESSAEVDFIVQGNSDIVPIEVKSGTNLKAKSLTSYITRYSPKYAVRISAQNFNCTGDIINIPLYAVGRFEEFLLARD
jgi:predicted AAA+ superfamily ATPase